MSTTTSAICGSPARARIGRSRSSISTRRGRTCAERCGSFPCAASRAARWICAVRSRQSYRRTLEGCYSCHKAADKPYLRPRIPEQPESRIINFDPAATRRILAVVPILFILTTVAGAADFTLKLPRGLQEQAAYVPDDNPLTRDKIALGKQLFWDKRLALESRAGGG